MERRELRSIMNNIKKELRGGKSWENLSMEGLEYEPDMESYCLEKKYEGTIKRDEMMEQFNIGKDEKIVILKSIGDYIEIHYDKEEGVLKAYVEVHYKTNDGFSDYGCVGICKMEV